jgi:hypothetical protein
MIRWDSAQKSHIFDINCQKRSHRLIEMEGKYSGANGSKVDQGSFFT